MSENILISTPIDSIPYNNGYVYMLIEGILDLEDFSIIHLKTIDFFKNKPEIDVMHDYSEIPYEELNIRR